MSTESKSPSSTALNRGLRLAAIAYVIGFIAHTADHARRGLSASPEPVIWIGTAGSMLAAVIVTLIVTGHFRARLVAAVGAAAHGIGIAAVHGFPQWGPLSDPLPGGRLDLGTWVAVAAEIGGAGFLAATAWSQLRNDPLGRALNDYESEHGAPTDAELEEARGALGLGGTNDGG